MFIFECNQNGIQMNEELDFLLDEINIQEDKSKVLRVTIERYGLKTIVEHPIDNAIPDSIRHLLQCALLGSGVLPKDVEYIFSDLHE
jgi:hypothetical protein